MKSRLFSLFAVAVMTVMAAGCYTSLDGRMKPGMPMSKDQIENRYERPADQVFVAAREVLKRNGTLTGENTISKTLEAKVDRSSVWVKVDEVEARVARVVVQARKRGGLKNIDLASELATQIGIQLATMR
jgi:type II secretory pathway component PulK